TLQPEPAAPPSVAEGPDPADLRAPGPSDDQEREARRALVGQGIRQLLDDRQALGLQLGPAGLEELSGRNPGDACRRVEDDAGVHRGEARERVGGGGRGLGLSGEHLAWEPLEAPPQALAVLLIAGAAPLERVVDLLELGDPPIGLDLALGEVA